MPRARKQPSTVIDAPEVKVPQVLITREQYLQDIKIRWQIHQYEVNKLKEDVNAFIQFASPYIKQSIDFVAQKWQKVATNH